MAAEWRKEVHLGPEQPIAVVPEYQVTGISIKELVFAAEACLAKTIEN